MKKQTKAVIVAGETGAVLGEYVSKSFKRKEFACKDGCGLGLGDGDINSELIEVIQDVRDHFGEPVVISSGLRCETHNKRVGGAAKSQHLLGTAADLRIAKVNPGDVYDYLDKKYPNKYGVGRYNTFTHIDVRANRARW